MYWYILIAVNLLSKFSNYFLHPSSIVSHLTFCCIVKLFQQFQILYIYTVIECTVCTTSP